MYIDKQSQIKYQLCECMSKDLISGWCLEHPLGSLVQSEARPRVTLCSCSEARP